MQINPLARTSLNFHSAFASEGIDIPPRAEGTKSPCLLSLDCSRGPRTKCQQRSALQGIFTPEISTCRFSTDRTVHDGVPSSAFEISTEVVQSPNSS
eukprot:1694935-Rhodomonas_salina.1